MVCNSWVVDLTVVRHPRHGGVTPKQCSCQGSQIDSRGHVVVLQAHVPLKSMFGYIGHLRALSSGRAQYSLQFDHYAVASAAVVDEVSQR